MQYAKTLPLISRGLSFLLELVTLFAPFIFRMMEYAMSQFPMSAILNRLLVENKHDVIYIYRLGPFNSFELLSPAIEKISGYSIAEWYSNPSHCLDVIHPDDRQKLLKPIEEKSTTFGPLVLRVFHQKTGEIVWTEHWGVIEYTSEKRPKAVAGIGRDISRQIAIADERARLLAQERTARINAEEAIRMKNEFFEALIHDLRTPLSSIVLRVDLLLTLFRNHKPEVPPLMETSVQEIQFSANRIKQMINDLVELIKLSTNRTYLDENRKQCSAATILNQSVTEHFPLAQKKGIKIRISSADPSIQIQVNEQRIYQSLGNVVSNAIKFSPERSTIQVGLKRDGHYALFSVSDEGPGVAQQELGRIFNRYWQDRLSTKEGLGLGLAIAKKIVESHGGEIWAERNSVRGSTFFFKLPSDGG
jgi:PAS domain S-box-containing protein